MKRQSIVFLGAAFLIIAFMVGCGGKDLQVVECDEAETISTENGKLVLTYKFNKPVDQGSVISGISFKVCTEDNQKIKGTFTYPDEYTLCFKSIDPVEELFPDGTCRIKVCMVGCSARGDWVADMDGNPIDGDYRDGYGGDFNAEYTFNL